MREKAEDKSGVYLSVSVCSMVSQSQVKYLYVFPLGSLLLLGGTATTVGRSERLCGEKVHNGLLYFGLCPLNSPGDVCSNIQ